MVPLNALLDENLAARLATALRHHGCDVLPFPKAWKGTKNGRLLARMSEDGTGCLITTDKNLTYQQTVNGEDVCVIVLPSPRFGDLEPIIANITDALRVIEAGTVISIDADGRFGVHMPKKK
ncbi:hypothetical protein SAMN06297251_110106 [Fulvimarina manganoxydans]|uniref:DUF5615 domain-containing protein n=1 Tax=Fulvimarina manganoxydans TaxID=937218 RepID=A0A1W2CIH0_9HYPH|nr:hypothetical protein SAMN06297251_110106 [Fulvimarina manganoxydans]